MSLVTASAKLSAAGVRHKVVTAKVSSKVTPVVRQLRSSIEEFQEYLELLDTVSRGSVTKPSFLNKAIAVNPDFRSRQYNDLVLRITALQKSLKAAHDQVFTAGIEKLYGRKPVASDYKVSAIGDSALPESVKEELRFLAHTDTALGYLKQAFTAILNKRSLK